MVIVIGFVSAGALSFKRTIPMILGTNVGSTFTTEFLAIKMDVLIWVLFIGGLVFILLRKYPFRQIGISFLGLGIIFLHHMLQPARRSADRNEGGGGGFATCE